MMKFPANVLALALLASPPAMAAIILIDGDTIDVDGTRIRIVQIDAPETFRPRCENELVLGLTAKERLRALLDSCPGDVQANRHGSLWPHAGLCYAGGVDVGERLLKEAHALQRKAQRLATRCGRNMENRK